MRRLLVNDALNQLSEHTFWNDLQEWFDCEFVGAPYESLTRVADIAAATGTESAANLIIRNATWFPPLEASASVPTISLLQDIVTEGPQREMQQAVIASSNAVVFNSDFTGSHYAKDLPQHDGNLYNVIPLPVDFSVFQPGNPMGLQQALSLPDGCVLWVGASQGAAGNVKGWDVFLSVVRLNPDLNFVAVFKDEAPETIPPNLRVFVRLPQEELAQVMGACRVGLCTSRTESQHLAGIEMGACGLPLVVPPVGTYWKRADLPGALVEDAGQFTAAIRGMLGLVHDAETIRAYWQKEFDKSVVRAAWERLVEEVETCSGRS